MPLHNAADRVVEGVRSVQGQSLADCELLVVDDASTDDSVARVEALAARATRYRNRLEGRSGTLWEGRYKSSPVQTETYLLACTRYIELNPVRARMVPAAGDYAWSSYRQRMGEEDCWKKIRLPLRREVARNWTVNSKGSAKAGMIDAGVSRRNCAPITDCARPMPSRRRACSRSIRKGAFVTGDGDFEKIPGLRVERIAP
ncbi:glycosyltransferase [Thioalkalivibrio sp. ALgr3]|uniref:glycosyltransferase family 2 protein n=1 Tax=Thioalkalivibrio sp. ALgr3 TaxID=1239292 RepID=UPI001E606FEF|nr:glycosyltransferase [Thioalkalivibrio sp. ALgr3]